MAESLQRYTAAAARAAFARPGPEREAMYARLRELASKDAPPPKRIGDGDGGGPDADGPKRPDVG